MLKLYFFVIFLLQQLISFAWTCPGEGALNAGRYDAYTYIFEVSLLKDYQRHPVTNSDYYAQNCIPVKVEKVYKKGGEPFLNRSVYIQTFSWFAYPLRQKKGTRVLVYAASAKNDTLFISACGRIRLMADDKTAVQNFGLLKAELDSLNKFLAADKSVYNLNGECKMYTQSGKLREEGMLKDGKREGEWTFYLQNSPNYVKGVMRPFYRTNKQTNSNELLFQINVDSINIEKVIFTQNQPLGNYSIYNLKNELVLVATLSSVKRRKAVNSEWEIYNL